MGVSRTTQIEVSLITLARTPFDAPGFLVRVERLINGSLALTRTPAAIIVQVDDWFDSKWLGFSGKQLGAVGIAKQDLTVPPFHPNRVLHETAYQRTSEPPSYVVGPRSPALHLSIPSEQNIRRRLRTVAPRTACFWYTSESEVTRRGALMAYLPAEDSYWAWYAALGAGEPWRVTRRKGVSPVELAGIEEAGAAAPAG